MHTYHRVSQCLLQDHAPLFLGQVGTHAISSPCDPLSHTVLPYLMAVQRAESMGMGSFAARLYANLAQCLGGIRSVAAATPHVAGGQLVL